MPKASFYFYENQADGLWKALKMRHLEKELPEALQDNFKGLRGVREMVQKDSAHRLALTAFKFSLDFQRIKLEIKSHWTLAVIYT